MHVWPSHSSLPKCTPEKYVVACAVAPEAEMVIDWVVRACWDVIAWRLRDSPSTSGIRVGSFELMLPYRFEITSITASRPCMSPPGNGYLASMSGVRTSERRVRFLVSRAKQ